MVKPPQQPAETAVVKLTAVAKPALAAPWPTQQRVADLAWELDRIYPDYQLMQELAERLETATEEWARKPLIKEAQKLIERFEMTGARNGIKAGRLEKLWDACSPEDWWPEDSDTPAYGQVAKMITVLMGSFPTAKIPEPEIFVPTLLDDVMALAPRFVELESTCRHLRKTKRFMPSISEVIETLEEQQELWNRRASTVWIEEVYNELCAEITKAKAAEVAEIKAPSLFALGDRVSHQKFGFGVVDDVDGNKITVVFDGVVGVRKVVADFLTRAAP